MLAAAHRVSGSLVVACMWDLVPQPGMEPGPPALGARSLTYWTTREVSETVFSTVKQKRHQPYLSRLVVMRIKPKDVGQSFLP